MIRQFARDLHINLRKCHLPSTSTLQSYGFASLYYQGFKSSKYSFTIPYRSYATFDYTRAPSKELVASFFDHQYVKINNWIFKDDQYRQSFLNYLRNQSSFSKDEIKEVVELHGRLVEVLNELQIGFQFLEKMWDAIFNRVVTDESVTALQKAIIEERDPLTNVLIRSARYDLYKKIITPRLNHSQMSINKSDELIEIIQLQSDKNAGITFNSKNIENYLLNENKNLILKQQLITLIICTSLKLNRGLQYTERDYTTQLYLIENFMAWTKMIENNEWFCNPDATQYDEVLKLIGIPPGDYRIEKYLQDILKLVEQEYQTKNLYIFITSIMRTLVDKAPHLTYKYFYFKDAQIRQRSLNRSNVLIQDDLTYTMQACLKFDSQKLFDLYKNNQDLHDGDEGGQESLILELSKVTKDWNALQKNFENMYGRGNLPLTVHYGIAMQALNTLRADEELGRLYDQLQKRGLHLNSTVMDALIRSKIRLLDQTKVIELFEVYAKMSSQGKADPKSVQKLFPLILKIPMRNRETSVVLDYLKQYLQREKETGRIFIDGSTFQKVMQYAVGIPSLKTIEATKALVEEYGKQSTEYYAGLISAYSNLDQFERADKMAYEAHRKSKIPFGEIQIWALQLKNNMRWKLRSPDTITSQYNEIKINFITKMSFCSAFQLFYDQGGISLISDIIQSLHNHGKLKQELAVFRRSKILQLRDERIYTTRLDFWRRKFEWHEILKEFDEMNGKNILITARTYRFVLAAVLNLDAKSGSNFDNSTDMLKQVLRFYGLSSDSTKNDRLSLEDDILYLARMVIDFVDIVGPEQSSLLYLNFVKQIYDKLGKNLDFRLSLILYEGLVKVFNEDKITMTKEFHRLGELVDSYIKDYPFKEVPIFPYRVTRYYGDMLVSWLKSHTPTRADELKILRVLQSGVKLETDQYTSVLKYFLEKLDDDEDYLDQVLKIMEDNLIHGNLDEYRSYLEKQLCYKICLKYLMDNYGDEDAIFTSYQILNNFYDINGPDQVRENLKSTNITNFLRSSSGRLFNIKTNPYGFKSMSHHKFLDYFNPEHIAQKGLFASNDLILLLRIQILKYCQNDKDKLRTYFKKHPKTMKFVMTEKSTILPLKFKGFRSIIDDISPLGNLNWKQNRIARASRVLKSLLLDTKYQMFITADANQSTPMLTKLPKHDFYE